MSSRLVRVMILVVLVAGASPPARSASTARTTEVTLTSPAGVKGKCELTLADDGTLTSKCRFENTTDKAKRFVFCFMLDLRAAKRAPVPGIGGSHYELEQVVVNGVHTLRCRPTAGAAGDSSSYHLGCKLVELGPKGTATLEMTSNGPYFPPPGVAVSAADFEVSYADTVDITDEAGKVFDDTSCKAVVGQGQFLVPVAPASAVWVFRHIPFKDPFVARQTRHGAEPVFLQYALLDDFPCSPADLPEDVPPQPLCPETVGDPPPSIVDLNLFWFESMNAAAGAEFPAVLSVSTRGKRSGLRVVTDPPEGAPFVIPGGRSDFGSVVVCRARPASECLAARVREGRRLGVTVRVTDPEGDLLFKQVGLFLQDSSPPVVISRSISATRRGKLRVEVEAEDAVTSPLAATFVYSIDRGRNWLSSDLRPTSDLLGSRRERSFVGTVGSFPGAEPGDSVRYYVTVQDEVFNVVWFGPKRTRVP